MWSDGGLVGAGENLSTGRKVSSCAFSFIASGKCISLGSNPGLCILKRPANRLDNSTAYLRVNCVSFKKLWFCVYSLRSRFVEFFVSCSNPDKPMRSALFGDITQRRVVIPYRRFGTTYLSHLNPLTPNDPYRGRTAPLTSKRCILYIY